MLTPTGSFALALHHAVLTLAASATFQGIVGAADATEARRKIFDGEIDEHSAEAVKPRAILTISGNHQAEKVAQSTYQESGEIELVLEIPPPPAYLSGRAGARNWFYSVVGGVIADMKVLAGTPGYLNIVNFTEQNTGRAAPEADNAEEYWATIWSLKWQG